MTRLQLNKSGYADKWPNRFWRFLLWPVADFQWREKISDRQLYQSLKHAIPVEMSANGTFPIVPHSLSPCLLLAGGMVQIGGQRFGPNSNFQEQLVDQGMEFVREDHVLRVTTYNTKMVNGIQVEVPTDWFFAFENGNWWQWKRDKKSIIHNLVQEFNFNREQGERTLTVGFMAIAATTVGTWLFYWLRLLWVDDVQ